MSIRSKKPLEGAESAGPRWTYFDVPCNCSAVGFMAGPPFGVYCHAVRKRSRPCRLLTSDGALSCELCARDRPEWRGFTPVYDREYVPRFVVVPKDYHEAVCEIPRFAQVKLYRAKAVTAPIVIRQENWRTTPIPPSAERDREPDLLPTLLRLWKDEELTRWHLSSDIPVSQAPVALAPRAGEPCTPEREKELMGQLIRDRIDWPGKDSPDAPGPKLLGDVLDGIASANGKHRKK